MNDRAFPIDCYVDALVRVFDKIQYRDSNYDRSERVKNLHYVYSEVAKHFAQPSQLDTLKINPKRVGVALQVSIMMVVYCWTKVSPEVMIVLAIHYTYAVLLDDSINDPHPEMASFFEDLVHGRQQKHPWLRLVNDHLPKVLDHYGSFCAFNIVRSTFDCEWLPEPRVLNLG